MNTITPTPPSLYEMTKQGFTPTMVLTALNLDHLEGAARKARLKTISKRQGDYRKRTAPPLKSLKPTNYPIGVAGDALVAADAMKLPAGRGVLYTRKTLKVGMKRMDRLVANFPDAVAHWTVPVEVAVARIRATRVANVAERRETQLVGRDGTTTAWVESNPALRAKFNGRGRYGKQRNRGKTTLTFTETLDILEGQEFTCFYTGEPLRDDHPFLGPISVERLNCAKPYTKDNCTVAYLRANSARNDMKLSEFVSMCKLIAAHL